MLYDATRRNAIHGRFSDPRDPPDVVAARAFEVEQIKVWVNGHYSSNHPHQ
jgi:hypothetical protein